MSTDVYLRTLLCAAFVAVAACDDSRPVEAAGDASAAGGNTGTGGLGGAGGAGSGSGGSRAGSGGASAGSGGARGGTGGQGAGTGGAGGAGVCALPFDPGPCRAAISVFAFVGGACVDRIYGGCEGNGNRFETLEECLATCEGRPGTRECPAGRGRARVCLACGPAGGCGESAEVCAQPCDMARPCAAPLSFCADGVCQAGGCI